MSELVLVANAGDGTISTLRLQRGERPRLEVLATSPVGDGCGTFAVDPDRDLVFAAYKGEPAGVATLRLDRESGELTEVARRAVPESMTYLSLAEGGSLLLGASYGGGLGLVWPLDGEKVGEPTSRVEFANLHCVVSDRNRAYFVSLGDDLVAQYTLATDGTLTPLAQPTVAAPEGSGPRHLVVDGSNAYLVTEFSGEAIRFHVRADGSLEPAEAVAVHDPSAGLKHSRYGADPKAEHLVWGADVHVAGPWLVCSERTASTLATVARDAEGRLGDVAAFTPTQKQPRGFAVTADGAFVVAVGEEATAAELSRVEGDGTLTSLGEVGIGTGANWVRILADR